ncbi:MAG TPA: glutamyl-tRNA reductase [Chitinophagaceae bacterium]|nr:glutamyl-tRNA reductase [Chitinophagaceae bacterium]
MQATTSGDISNFYAIGINYKKFDAEVRCQFAISPRHYEAILLKASQFDVHEVFILSTCNRTEIYGFAGDAMQLINLLCSETAGNIQTFLHSAYIKNGKDAVAHLFEVGAGLDSQILGDYEIIGQIKSAVKFSKEHQRTGSFTERLVNSVLQSSKAIKNQTALSGGTVSVSFAAVQFIKENIEDVKSKNILLIGTGKIGRSTCKNLVDYLETDNITLINRTEEKASELAKELKISHATVEKLQDAISDSDIILIAVNADEPVVLASHLHGKKKKLIIDLSVPGSVEKSAEALDHIEIVNVDHLSKMKDETLAKRLAEVPKAKEIIVEHIGDFMDWYDMRKHVPVLKAMKTKLKEINSTHAEEKIQRVINGMASKMRLRNEHGCHYIEAINEYLAPGSN